MFRILIVDDSITARNSLKQILLENNHTVIGEAADGEEGFQKYLSLKPDIVTMDITMPVLNGIGSLKKIISSDPEARVIVISSLGQNARVLEALNLGAKHYITKPFEAENVLQALNEVMSS